MKRSFFKIALFTIALSVGSCKSTSNTTNDNSSQSERNDGGKRGGNQQNDGQRNKRPSADQIIAQMDTNKDGKLAKSEVKGPIKNDFSKIDTNNDGFISKEELDNAPKPEGRGQRRQ